MGYVHIAHDCKIGNNTILANGVTLGGHVTIGDFTVIGGLVPIHQFVNIGEFVMIAGASAVAQDVPHYCMVEGNRASLRGLNLTGLRRQFDRKDIDVIRRTYTELFRSGKPLLENAKELIKSEENEYAQKMLNFVIENKRGISFKREESVDEKK
jgi:UDP-N-acetylglucosamine acyltransferase